MKKRTFTNLKTMLILIVLIAGTGMIEIFAWWSFVVPVLLLGVLAAVKNWEVSGFMVGFLAGFIVWFGANWYFDMTLNGVTLNKLGLLLSIPKIAVFLFSGITGGLLTGLAFFAGKSILAPRTSSLL